MDRTQYLNWQIGTKLFGYPRIGTKLSAYPRFSSSSISWSSKSYVNINFREPNITNCKDETVNHLSTWKSILLNEI